MGSTVKLFGHPVHSVLTPFPLGLVGTAMVFDLMAMFNGSDNLARAAYWMIAAGMLSGMVVARGVDGLVGAPGTGWLGGELVDRLGVGSTVGLTWMHQVRFQDVPPAMVEPGRVSARSKGVS